MTYTSIRRRWAGALWVALWAPCLGAQASDPQQLFQQAIAAQQRGDGAGAVRAYQELLRIRPDAVAVRVNLGATLAQLQRFPEAIEQYRLVLTADPANRMARMNLALAYQANDQLAEAIPQLERLRREDATDPQPTMLLADCLAQAGRYGEVVTLLAALEPAQPENLDLQWLLGSSLIRSARPAEGIDRVEKVAERGASADAYLLAGQTRLAMNQYDLAQRDAQAAGRLNPALPGLLTLNGMILEQTGDYDAAQTSLEKAIAANPDDYDAHFYLGAILYFKRDLPQAQLHLERAMALQPSSVQAKYELALVARADGRLDIARQYLETVVGKSPEWLQPHVELAALYYRLHRPADGAREKKIVDQMMAAQQQSQAKSAR